MDIKNIFQRTVIILYVSLSLLYISWRVAFTLNMDQPVASILFLFADVVTCFSAILFVVTFWRKPNQSCMKNNCQLSIINCPLSVDVFVTTYNEDCDMLETTLQHCIDMDYPHQTWLLDDGNRPEMKLLAEKLGVEYIARETNADAKAGNLNNAMQYTQGKLIAVFDADFRPEKEFLTRLTTYFLDNKVAIAQVPQSYYNTDSFQHRRLFKNDTYSDQDTFMHLVLPARNNWNAAYWIGTNALLRREAIESTGGFPTDCVTEDVLASMFIHGKGWKSVYVDEPLAYGRAPANISEYFVQRLRWAKGAFQILRSHNPLIQKGLSLIQRLFYFSSVSHFFEGIAKIIYYLFPALFFLFGIIPIRPYPSIITAMLIYFGVTHILTVLITNGRTNIVMDEVYSVIRSFIYLMALPAFVAGKNIRFRVTPKNGRTAILWQGVIGPTVILGFNLVAVVAVAYNPYTVASLGILGWICFGWCLYMGGIAFTACYYAINNK